ncbi:hypothetical protein, partial [Rhizobium johnstonii]|uniref:hypothetical protein n=1 Tax=Rhizobium johnstonii TaxID=3019933 RepID=UPI003F9C6FC7
GYWEPEGKKSPEQALAKVDFKFTLEGKRLHGSFVLVRMRNEIRQIDLCGRFRFPTASGALFSLFGRQSVIAVPDGISLNVANLDNEGLGLS